MPDKYIFYILSKDEEPGKKKLYKYTISATCFVCTLTPKECIFQMLKDTFFSLIVSEDDIVEFDIVAIKESKKLTKQLEKEHILNYFNNTPNLIPESIIIKKLFNYRFKIKDCLHNNSIITNTTDELLNNIELTFAINDSSVLFNKKQKYISNPSFTISKTRLNELLK